MCYCMSVGVCTHLSYTILYVCIFNLSGDLRDLHSFPTRRSSDLVVPALGARPAPRFPCLRHIVVLSDRADADSVGWREMLAGGRRVSDDTLRGRASQVDPEQSAFILYTSGTSGVHKGAVHNHRIIRNTGAPGD